MLSVVTMLRMSGPHQAHRIDLSIIQKHISHRGDRNTNEALKWTIVDKLIGTCRDSTSKHNHVSTDLFNAE